MQACHSADASQLLRDILQSKEYKSHLLDNNNSNTSIKDLYPPGGDCNSEMISPLLQSKSSDMAYNDRDNNEIDIDNDNDDDMNESGVNESFDSEADASDTTANSTSEDLRKSSDKVYSLEESKEAKRAHVENILTSMRQSPHMDTFDVSLNSSMTDVKRQKRKQPQPQQFDSANQNCEELALQRQMLQYQEQIRVSNKRRSEDDDSADDNADSDPEANNNDVVVLDGSKRVKVEHLFSNSRTTIRPPRSLSPHGNSGFIMDNDSVKKQKRKQTQPQQHDITKTGDLKEAELNEARNRYNSHISSSKVDSNSEDAPEGFESSAKESRTTGSSAFVGPDAMFRNNWYRSLAEKELMPALHNGFDHGFYRDNFMHHGFFGIRPDLDPMAAMRHLTKSLNGRTEHGLQADANGKIPPVDVVKIADALKRELVQAMDKAIENAVSKVLSEKQINALSEAAEQQSQQQQQHPQQQQPNHQERPNQHERHHPQIPQQQKVPHSLPRAFPQSHSHTVMTHPQHHPQPTTSQNPDRDIQKDTTNISQTSEKKPELIVPFSDHLHFLERFGNRLQQEKSAFDPIHKPESELITPHTGPTVPFHPHFPYYLPTQMLPPMYPEEPQTEALPLIVSTPKKKRTKVTDTRLNSPRGKSGPLDSPLTPGMEQMEAQRHLAATAFPHFLPQVLPTSVAITNPSLNHSDLLALRLREASFAESRNLMAESRAFVESRIPSPQDQQQSRGSPRSPSDSPYMYERGLNMSSDAMDNNTPNGHLISFLRRFYFQFSIIIFLDYNFSIPL